jgi:predicted nucleic acid-binding protein
MKVLLDSDVLVAALHRSHPAHSRAIPWLARTAAGETQAIVAAQSVAQVYRVLTTVSFGQRLAPSEASDVIERSVMPWCSVRTLNGRRQFACIRAASRRGVAGGAVYDALIAEVERAARVEAIITFNLRDFRRVAPDLTVTEP